MPSSITPFPERDRRANADLIAYKLGVVEAVVATHTDMLVTVRDFMTIATQQQANRVNLRPILLAMAGTIVANIAVTVINFIALH